jgi:hypothetical protein
MPVLFKSGDGPVSSIINRFSSGGVSSTNVNASTTTNALEITAGSAYSSTPGTLQTVLSVTGRGRVNLLTAYAKDATVRTIRLRITIDGAVAFDATTNSIGVGNTGLVAIGWLTVSGSGTTTGLAFQPVDYQESILIEAASSVSNDAAANIGFTINRETWAS